MLLNPNKSEVLLVANQRHVKKIAPGSGVSMAGTKITSSATLEGLGVTLLPACAGCCEGQKLSQKGAAAHQTNTRPRCSK